MEILKLQGSPKQVEWATKIKETKIQELRKLLYGVKPIKGHEDDAQCLHDSNLYKGRIVKSANEIVDAKWWIDNKDITRLDLLYYIMDNSEIVQKYKNRFLEKYQEC